MSGLDRPDGGRREKTPVLFYFRRNSGIIINQCILRVGGRGQRVHPPGLLVALDDGLYAGLHKEDFIRTAHAVQLVEGVKQPIEGLAAPDIGDQGHPVIAARPGHAQLGKFGHQRGGHVVHHVEPDILQKGGHLTLSRTGQAGYNDKFHCNLLFPRPVRTPAAGPPAPAPRRSPAAPSPEPVPSAAARRPPWRRPG